MAGLLHNLKETLKAGLTAGLLAGLPFAGAGGPVAVVSDSFNRADSNLTLGNADTGQAWNPLIGTWGISGGFAKLIVDGTNNENIAVIDSGVSDCMIEVVAINPETGWRVTWRAQDGNHHFMILYVGGNINLYKKTGAGSFTQIGTGVVALVHLDVVQVTTSGSAHSLVVNGVEIIAPVTDAAYLTETEHGIGDTGVGGTERWKDFKVYAL